MKNSFAVRIRPHVTLELAAAGQAVAAGDPAAGFAHLERAHVLGQASTFEHVRVHLHMLWWAMRGRDPAAVAGQLLRIVGAATMTAFGLVPGGNTGGTDISPFKPMPVPLDLARIIESAASGPWPDGRL